MPDIIDSLVDFTDYDKFRLWIDELREALNIEEWRNVSTDSVNGFENSWTNTGTPTAAFYRDPFGIVHIKGIFNTGTSGTTAFTLPVGYRPTETMTFPGLGVSGSQLNNTITITTAGLVQPTRHGADISITDLTFRVELS